MFDRQRFTRRALWVWIFLFLLLCLMLLRHLAQPHLPQPPIIYANDRLIIPEHSNLRSVISVKAIEEQLASLSLELPATIQVRSGNSVAIYPPLPGQIKSISQEIGSLVHKGDALYTMISPALTQIKKDLLSAEANHLLAEQTLKRQQELIQYHIGPVHNLQLAENDAVEANAELQRAKLRLTELHIDEAEKNAMGEFVVRAPIDGIIASVNAGIGSYWSDLTTPVMSLVNIDTVNAVAALQESDLAFVSVGEKASVKLPHLKKTYQSALSWISPVLDPSTRTVDVGVVLDNPDHGLRPNMFVHLTLQSKPQSRLILPLTAVIQRGFESIVFVEVAPWEFEERAVKVGNQMGDRIEIISGLATHERIAMTGGIILND